MFFVNTVNLSIILEDTKALFNKLEKKSRTTPKSLIMLDFLLEDLNIFMMKLISNKTRNCCTIFTIKALFVFIKTFSDC